MKLEDLFNFHNGVATTDLDISPIQDEFYDIPFLRPSSMALNSIVGFVSSLHISEKYIFEANSLYVSTNGQGSHTYSYVYPVPFSVNSDVTVLIPKRKMTLEEKLYYATIITANRYKFSYGRKPKGERLKQITIPIYEEARLVKLQEVVKQTKQPFVDNNLPVLQTYSWQKFNLLEVFKVKLGTPIHSIELEESVTEGIPYVTRTTYNNGIEFFAIENSLTDLCKVEGNVITIGAEAFEAFYQKSEFITGNKINILSNKNLNKFNAMFLCSILNLELKKKFNYGRGATKDRISCLSIKLPTLNNQPDFEFMENYIKSLPYSSSI